MTPNSHPDPDHRIEENLCRAYAGPAGPDRIPADLLRLLRALRDKSTDGAQSFGPAGGNPGDFGQ